jgi:tetratricopeptide (TPR) repeat protein
MGTKGTVLSVLIILFAALIICGCVNNISGTSGLTTSTIVPKAIDLHNTGFDAYLKGDYPTALGYFNQSIAADPNYLRAWIDKGNALVRLNRSEEAVVAYDAALARGPDRADVWNSRGEALMTTGNYTAARDSFDKALQIAPEYAAAKENRDLARKKLQ